MNFVPFCFAVIYSSGFKALQAEYSLCILVEFGIHSPGVAQAAGQPQGEARVALSLGFGGPRTAGQSVVAVGKCQHMGANSSQECHQLLVAFGDAVPCHRRGGTAPAPPVPRSLVESEQCEAQQGLTCLVL